MLNRGVKVKVLPQNLLNFLVLNPNYLHASLSLSFSVSLSLPRPLYKWELPFLASLSSPETCQYQLHTPFKVQRLASHYTHLHTLSWPLLCLGGIFNFSVCAHIWICLHVRTCVCVCVFVWMWVYVCVCVRVCGCHRWYGSGDSALIIAVTKSIAAPSRLSSPFSWERGWEGKDGGRT